MPGKPRTVRIRQFDGLVKDVHPARLSATQFQTDDGSERESGVSWKPRKGMVRTNHPKSTASGNINRAVHAFETQHGDTVVIAQSVSNHLDGYSSVAAGDGSGATQTGLSTTLATTVFADFAAHNGSVYCQDGRDAMLTWDGVGSTTQSAGISGAPTDWTGAVSAGAGSNTTLGSHRFRYRYKNSVTGYVSDPSNEVAITVASGGEQLTFSIAAAPDNTKLERSTDAKVDTLVVEMTLLDGTVFYKAGETLQTASTIVIDSSDDTLANSPLLWPDGRISNGVPPVRRWVTTFLDRLWTFGEEIYSTGTVNVQNASASVTGTGTDWKTSMQGKFFRVDGDTTVYKVLTVGGTTSITLDKAYAGSNDATASYKIYGTDNSVYCSKAGYPESWHPFDFFPGPKYGGPITACIGAQGGLTLFNAISMERYNFNGDPILTGYKRQISDERGALNQRVVVVVEGTVYAMDKLGWHRWRGTVTEAISSQIDDTLSEIDFSNADKFHAIYYPRLRAIRWFVILSTTEPQNYFQFDIDTGAWSRGERGQGITSSCHANTPNGKQVLLGCENGYTWLDDQSTVDGLATANATESHVAVTSSTSTVVTASGATFPTSGTGMDGVVAYHVEGDETKVITANTGTTFTTAAWSQTPVNGDTIYLGQIKSKLKTKAFAIPRDRNRTESVALWLRFEPHSSSRTLRVRLYEDYSATAKTWGDATVRAAARGYTFPSSVNYFTVDLSITGGVVRVPLSLGNAWAYEVELEVIEPDARFALLTIEFDGVGLEDV